MKTVKVADVELELYESGQGSPVLFLHGDYDYTCETVVSRLAEPMQQDCSNLSEVIIQSGHWMAQEKPVEVNAAIAKWLATALPAIWPV